MKKNLPTFFEKNGENGLDLTKSACNLCRKVSKNLNGQDVEKVCTPSQFPKENNVVIMKTQIWR